MPNIEDQQLIYHITSLKNMRNILKEGLLPRSMLQDFKDIADQEIIKERKAYNLEEYVPFHWFAKNPFDGRVQVDRPNEDFVLITVLRSLAEKNNWKIIPRHPLSKEGSKPIDYQKGFKEINWEMMNKRDYLDIECRSVCMSECLSPGKVPVGDFYNIYVRNDEVKNVVCDMLKEHRIEIWVKVNENMFT